MVGLEITPAFGASFTMMFYWRPHPPPVPAIERRRGNTKAGTAPGPSGAARERVPTAGAFIGQRAAAHSSLAGNYAFAGHLAEARAEAEAAVNAAKAFKDFRRADAI